MPPSAAEPFGASDYYEDDAEGGQFPLRRILLAVLRYKWLVLAVTMLGTAAGLAYVRTLPSEYRARATVWLEPGRVQGSEGPIRSRELLSASGWIELLRSYQVLDQVAMEERLFLQYDDPTVAGALAGLSVADDVRPGAYRLDIDRRSGGYQLSAGGDGVLEAGTIGDSIGSRYGLLWQPTPAELGDHRRIEFSVRSPRDAAMELGNRVQASMDRTGNFMRLEMRGPSPDWTSEVLNALADRFVDVAGELKRAHLVELTEILEDQLDYAQRNLEVAERDLESFRVATITLPSDQTPPVAAGLEATRSPVLGSFFQLRLEQDQLRRDRQAILAAISGESIAVEALELIPSAQGFSELGAVLNELGSARAELRALRHRYTDEHIEVQTALEQVRRLERETVPGVARGVANQLAARERSIGEQIGEVSREMEQIPPRAIEEAKLRRQVAVSEDMYTNIQRRYEETRLASASTVPDVRILDRATAPDRPMDNQKTRLLLVAFLGSLGLGLLGAVLRDRFDHTLRYADQVTEELGLPVLGAVPELGDRKRLADRKGTAEALEAFRGIRMNVMYAYGAAGPVTLAVSSPGPGDGKSFVTSNLALSFADLGRRVLLIDGDIRRGGLHRTLERKRSPGLTDFLTGEATLQQVVQDTPYPKVSFIGSGRLRLTAPELISSPQMRELLGELKSQYDVILIDTAPLGAGVDPFVFGTLTGNLILVLRTDTTNRDLAEAKLGLASRLPLRILGSVINGLKDSDRTYSYRYYSYLPGYESVEEDRPATPRLPKVAS